MLMETVKAAEGRNDVDRVMMEELEDQPAPGDVDVMSPTTASGPSFGLPEPDDPDPFGVLALEAAGLEIREAGTKSRPASSQFEYNPSPTSPAFSRFHRRSMDTLGTSSNRESYISTRSNRTRTSTDRYTQMSEMGTQTDFDTPGTSPSHTDEHKRIIEEDETPIEKEVVKTPEEIDYTKMDLGPYSNPNRSEEFDGTTVNDSINDSPRELDNNDAVPISIDSSFVTDDEDDLDEEEPVIFEAAQAQATIVTPTAIKARGGLVNIPKRPPPPPLPPRSMARSSRNLMVDQASGRSPLKSEFEEVELHGSPRRSVESRAESPLKNPWEDLETPETVKVEKIDIVAPIEEKDIVVPEKETKGVVIPEVVHHEPEVKRESKVPGGFDDY
ncbi:hypothetical protein M7I_2687 [Glarea lozoyensis 74030]|nr:hypothetical protein M7I_2687 [Glarea lozoyensis 74030]